MCTKTFKFCTCGHRGPSTWSFCHSAVPSSTNTSCLSPCNRSQSPFCERQEHCRNGVPHDFCCSSACCRLFLRSARRSSALVNFSVLRKHGEASFEDVPLEDVEEVTCGGATVEEEKQRHLHCKVRRDQLHKKLKEQPSLSGGAEVAKQLHGAGEGEQDGDDGGCGGTDLGNERLRRRRKHRYAFCYIE